MQLVGALRHDLPACDCRLRLRVDERLNRLQGRRSPRLDCDDLILMVLQLSVALICFLLAQVDATFLVVLTFIQDVKPRFRRPSGSDYSSSWIKADYVRLAIDLAIIHDFQGEEIFGAVIGSLCSHCLMGSGGWARTFPK